jgi:hypothetical protein
MGIKEVNEKIGLVTFMNYDLGFFDDETGRVEFVVRSLVRCCVPPARL